MDATQLFDSLQLLDVVVSGRQALALCSLDNEYFRRFTTVYKEVWGAWIHITAAQFGGCWNEHYSVTYRQWGSWVPIACFGRVFTEALWWKCTWNGQIWPGMLVSTSVILSCKIDFLLLLHAMLKSRWKKASGPCLVIWKSISSTTLDCPWAL